MQDTIIIDGAAYFAVAHRDGRFIRKAGRAALARRDADGGYTVLHLEHCEAINRAMAPGHPRWAWALGQGLNTLLVERADGVSDPAAPSPPIRYLDAALA
jgi:hypothetical protein